jgi:hypothetical protein
MSAEFDRLRTERDAAVRAAGEVAQANLASSYTGRLKHISEVAAAMHRETELRNATWEPHDWSDFD